MRLLKSASGLRRDDGFGADVPRQRGGVTNFGRHLRERDKSILRRIVTLSVSSSPMVRKELPYLRRVSPIAASRSLQQVHWFTLSALCYLACIMHTFS